MAQDMVFAGRTGKTAPVYVDAPTGTLGPVSPKSGANAAVLPGGLHLRCLPSNHAVVVEVEGEVDVHTRDELRAVLDELTSTSPHRAVILELSEMSFIDAAGISVLMWALGRTRATGRCLVLRNVRPPVLKVFRLLGLDGVFTIAP